MKAFDNFKQIIDKNDRFLLICHEDSDGDALGSMISIHLYLESLDKKNMMVARTSPPTIFSFLESLNEIRGDFLLGDFDVIILLDNGDLKRTGFADRIREAKKLAKPVVNIDHHISNDIWKLATLNMADIEKSSTSEIVYGLLKYLKAVITPGMATALLTGMYCDTGGFHHSNTTDDVLDATSDLLHFGANLKKISKSISQNRTINMLKLWGIALDRIVLDKSKKIATTFITRKDIADSEATEEEISGLVNLVNSAEESRASLLLYETSDGKIKGSLRTEDDNVDVAKIAALLGGGGHKKAAGFSIRGKFRKSGEHWKVV